MPRPVEGTSPYLPGLDGIRAIAVLAVLAFHLNFGWASGGLLGVQVFFVLSGYLITDLLVAEYRRHQGIGLKQFWLRRARRLLPALFVVLFVTVGWATLFDRVQLTALRSDLPSSIFYFSNCGSSSTTSPTSPGSALPRPSGTCGRSRSRSSST